MPYADLARRIGAATDYESGPVRAASPELVAVTVRRAIEARKPKAIYRVGPMSRAVVVLLRLMPPRLFDRMISLVSK